jgi:hypothetical protein
MTDTKTWVGLGILLVASIPFLTHMYRVATGESLRRNGVAARAVVVEVRDMKQRFSFGPDVEIKVRFEAGGREVTGSSRQRVPVADLQRLRPGAEVQIYYDPDEPTRIALAEF